MADEHTPGPWRWEDDPGADADRTCARCGEKRSYSHGSLKAAMTDSGNVVCETDDWNIATICQSCAASLGQWWKDGSR